MSKLSHDARKMYDKLKAKAGDSGCAWINYSDFHNRHNPTAKQDYCAVKELDDKGYIKGGLAVGMSVQYKLIGD